MGTNEPGERHMILFQTEDLYGDTLCPQDAEEFHRICNMPFVLRWMDDWQMSLEQVKGLIGYFMQGYVVKDPEKNPYIIAIRHRETGRLIGICGFGPKEELGGDAEIAYFMDEAYTNKGYMSQIVERAVAFYFELTGKSYLSALVDERNVPSKKILVKMGFVYHEVHDPAGRLQSHYRRYRDGASIRS